jgi:serine/threonine protein phosphatase PrpC
MQCPDCGESAIENAQFCEACGRKLVDRSTARDTVRVVNRCRCGAGPEDVDEQGYCTACGIYRARLLRDHHEEVLSSCCAAVTDRGVRHPHNEDDMSLGMETIRGCTAWILVVCDGLSSAQYADNASAIAAVTARDTLATFARGDGSDPVLAMNDAIHAAQRAVCAIDYSHTAKRDPPETTIVAALVRDGVATIGWVGDSRAYWISADRSVQLTRDHSWVNETVDAGEMSEEEALRSSNAHVITRCLGRAGDDEHEEIEPSLTTFAIPTDSALLLCSDGLWNYAPAPEDLARLVRGCTPDADAFTIANSLVEFAREAGGHDNITAALLLDIE